MITAASRPVERVLAISAHAISAVHVCARLQHEVRRSTPITVASIAAGAYHELFLMMKMAFAAEILFALLARVPVRTIRAVALFAFITEEGKYSVVTVFTVSLTTHGAGRAHVFTIPTVPSLTVFTKVHLAKVASNLLTGLTTSGAFGAELGITMTIFAAARHTLDLKYASSAAINTV